MLDILKMMDPQKRKLVILLACGVGVLLIIGVIASIAASTMKAKIEVLVAPSDATVLIDGKKYKAGEHKIASGEHTYEVSRDGFDTYTDSFSISDDEFYGVYAALESNRDDTASFYRDNDSEMKNLEEVRSKQAGQDSLLLATNYPVFTKLPHRSSNFRIDYGKCKKSSYSMCLLISAAVGAKSQALGYISTIDDIAKYHVEFVDHDNPFKGEH